MLCTFFTTKRSGVKNLVNDGVTLHNYLHSEDVLVPLFPVGALGDVQLARLLRDAEQAVVAAHDPEVDCHLLLYRGLISGR